MSNYNKSKIYKIWCEDEGVDQFYIGSSVNLKDRTKEHKADCYNPNRDNYNNKLYTYIRANFGFENFTISTIERYSCNSKKALRKREQYWINELKPSLNSNKSYISKIQKKIQHRQIIDCDHCDKTYTYNNKSRHLQSKYCINYNLNKSV
jgi:group I intron endonuclease